MPNKQDYIHYHFTPKKTLQAPSHYPKITNVQATGSGLLTWTTDIPSTSQAQYGTTPMLGPITPFDGALVTNHSVQLSGLASSTSYYFRVQSFYLDSLSISDLYSFTTLGDLLLEDGTFILLEDGTKIQLES